jgi:predicted outer membrane repeat protein
MTMRNGKVSDDEKMSGGAISADESTVIIYHSIFKCNQATGLWGGGAILAYNGADVEVHDSTFQSNTAAASGGAILVGTGAIAEIHASQFISNSAINSICCIGSNAGNICSSDLDCPGSACACAPTECVDDPTGEVEKFGTTCAEASVAYGCDFDISLVDSSKPRGTLLAAACPVTCDSCSDARFAVMGGAIVAYHSANVEIHDSIFQSNNAYTVSRSSPKFWFQKIPELSSLQFPAGHVQLLGRSDLCLH